MCASMVYFILDCYSLLTSTSLRFSTFHSALSARPEKYLKLGTELIDLCTLLGEL